MATIEKRTTNSAISYRAKVRLKGYPTQSATFVRLTDAKKWVQDTESAIREGRHFKTSESKKHTVKELVERYIKEILPQKPKSTIDQKTEYYQPRLMHQLLVKNPFVLTRKVMLNLQQHLCQLKMFVLRNLMCVGFQVNYLQPMP